MNENPVHCEFDLYLDGLAHRREPGAMDDIASFARDLHAQHGITRLDPDRREAIWRGLMATATPDPVVTTGGAGPLFQPTLVEPHARNPWVRRPEPASTSAGWRGAMAKAQTLIAIVATLALLATTVGLLQDRENGDGGRAPNDIQFAAVPTRLMAATHDTPVQTMEMTGTGDLVVPPIIHPGMDATNTGDVVVPPTGERTNGVTGTGDLADPDAPGTPAPDEDWLAPIMPGECVIREPRRAAERADASMQAAEIPERAYAPFSIPPATDAEDAATTLRQYEACLLALQNADGYVSDRFNADTSDAIDDQVAQAARGEEISGAYAGWERADFIVMAQGPEGTPAPEVRMRITEGPGLYQPHHAVRLADGRLAIPTTLVYPEGFDAEGFPAFLGNITVLVDVDGTWLIDERLPFCVGECDDFWRWMQSPGTPPGTIATPGTVIEDDLLALVPVDDNIWRECPAYDGPRMLGVRNDTSAPPTMWPGSAVPPTIPCEIGWPPRPPDFTPVPMG